MEEMKNRQANQNIYNPMIIKLKIKINSNEQIQLIKLI